MKRILSHLFLPHESNNHRAKFLHHSTLVLILLAIFGLHFFTTYTSENYQEVLGVSTDITPTALFELTNRRREEVGLSPLVLNDELVAASQMKAQDMFQKDYWAHNSPEGTTPWVWVKGSGYDYLYAGENLARGFTTSDAVVQAWMDSPGHRENLLSSNYEDIGFAIQDGTLTGDNTILVVQMFGKEKHVEPIPEFTSDSEESIERGLVVASDLSGQSVEVNEQQIEVASVQSQPLVDVGMFSKVSTSLIIFLLIGVLLLDLIVIERKNIVRILSHNVDHAIFLGIILLVIAVVGSGVIL
jgi:hypothetical protein